MNHLRRRVVGFRFAIALLSALWGDLAAGQQLAAASYSEEAVKAAFLYRFAGYVEWPAGAVRDTPFTIGVMGDESVLAELRRLLPGLSIQNRPAEVRKVASIEDLGSAEILYVGPGALVGAGALLSAAASRPILIVTDGEDGFEGGGVINFVKVGRNLRFEVSLTAAERSGLKISSGLLSVAARVEGRPRADATCTEAPSWRTRQSQCSTRFAMTNTHTQLTAGGQRAS